MNGTVIITKAEAETWSSVAKKMGDNNDSINAYLSSAFNEEEIALIVKVLTNLNGCISVVPTREELEQEAKEYGERIIDAFKSAINAPTYTRTPNYTDENLNNEMDRMGQSYKELIDGLKHENNHAMVRIRKLLHRVLDVKWDHLRDDRFLLMTYDYKVMSVSQFVEIVTSEKKDNDILSMRQMGKINLKVLKAALRSYANT